jgi:HTH-type transcriptional regulator/antitoxin HipB
LEFSPENSRRFSSSFLGSLIENGHPAAKLETLPAIMAALDLEFRIGPRSKGSEQEIEDWF